MTEYVIDAEIEDNNIRYTVAYDHFDKSTLLDLRQIEYFIRYEDAVKFVEKNKKNRVRLKEIKERYGLPKNC